MASRRQPVFACAETQRGLVTTAQIRSLSTPRGVVRGMLADGSLRQVTQKVLIAGGARIDVRAKVLIGVLDVGGYASRRTACWLHGIPGFVPPSRPDVIRLGRKSTYGSDVANVHTTTSLPKDDVLVVDQIPVLSVARTLMTLAAMVPMISAERVRSAVDDAVRMRLATDPWLWSRLEAVRCRGRNGVKVMEAILTARANSPTESWLEREFLAVLVAFGVPLPVCQARIRPRGAFAARVDFLYPDLRIIIEVAGAVAHASPEQRASDAKRRNALLMEGYLVLEFTYEQVVEQPAQVVADVRQAMALRAAA